LYRKSQHADIDIFVGKVANVTGRDLSKGQAGRPKKQ